MLPRLLEIDYKGHIYKEIMSRHNRANRFVDEIDQFLVLYKTAHKFAVNNRSFRIKWREVSVFQPNSDDVFSSFFSQFNAREDVIILLYLINCVVEL